MSSNSVDVNTLVEAVAEDSDLQPIEKETQIFWTKDGRPTVTATEHDRHVARVYTEEAGLTRRLLQYPHFTQVELRVNDSVGKGRHVEPHNFSGGTVTGVGGYVPIATVKIQTSMRSTSGHADVVPYQRSSSDSAHSQSQSGSGSSGSPSVEYIAEDSPNEDSGDTNTSDSGVESVFDW